MVQRWQADYAWQYGHGSGFRYELAAQVAAPVLVELEQRVTGHHGGASASRQGSDFVLVSTGEDACNSLEYLAADVADVVEAFDPVAELTWVQRPPVPVDGGPPTVFIEGYWIPGDEVAGYYDRRDRMLVRIAAATDDVCDEVRIAVEDGMAAIKGTRHGEEIFALVVGSSQLDMMDECDTRDLLREYVLG